ncbi:protein phosphatase 2C domain-containing protein [Yinghuangia seranimata]|uniref:protein phosphatase 2C domain-containing protein n=1 Tax=Yinghuangia seranimata TaxID=408067 RepID=UPI00248D0457|nr:protein phosphatase 2C domain-containing protein [Yinghuangia seranimata]MDI2127781.1 protein phosphatase 2C domain-containing protein [Yinghuangia seranimata]
MPDGFDRRPTTGDRPPAPRPAAKPYDEDDDYDAGYGDPYEDDFADADDDLDDRHGRPPGRARRIANWLGFGTPPPMEDEEDAADLYDDTGDTRDARNIRDARDTRDARDAGDALDGRTTALRAPAPRSPRDAGSDTADIPPQPTAPPPVPPEPGAPGRDARGGERTRNTRPWEVLLGSVPPPGTPMSDTVPADTLVPDSRPVGLTEPDDDAELTPAPEPGNAAPLPTRPVRRRDAPRGGAKGAGRADARGEALANWLDPVDPVDPLDPRNLPTPDAETPTRETAPTPAVTTAAAAAAAAIASARAARDFDAPTTADPTPAQVPAPKVVAQSTSTETEFADDSPEPRRMLRLLPTPVLADGGGMVVDGGRVGRLTARVGAVRGDLHTQQGVPRQNCVATGPDPSGSWTISIICDGVDGSYAPELAAQVAVRSTYRAVARMVAADRHENWDWTTTLAAVQTDLRTRLTEIGSRARTLGRPAPATRLAVLVTAAEPLQDDRVDMAVLGDSTILRLAEGGWRAPLGIRETPGDVPTPALPDQGTEHVRVCRTTWRPSDALVVMTGGFAESLGATSGALAARLAEDWRRPPELLDFLRDIAQGSRNDDGAVIALWPEP